MVCHGIFQPHSLREKSGKKLEDIANLTCPRLQASNRTGGGPREAVVTHVGLYCKRDDWRDDRDDLDGWSHPDWTDNFMHRPARSAW